MSVLIGHASIDERGKANGGQAGDQNGKEVYTRDWWAGGWDLLLRPKDPDVANRMATACEVLCRSNLVGYDQYQRNTLWDELEKVNWAPTKLKVKCETDCSAFMTACARCAGVEVLRTRFADGRYNAPVTSTMKNAFLMTGRFEAITNREYLTGSDLLKRGDILVRTSGHTVMVLTNGGNTNTQASTAAKPNASIKPDVAKSRDPQLSGSYVCTAGALNVRSGAGTAKPILTVIKRDQMVQCYGYYTQVDSVRWLYVQFMQNGRNYVGFVSERYLEKKA